MIDAKTQRLLADTLTLANQLGAMVFTFKGQDVADTILRFAYEYRVGQVVIGRPRPVRWWKRLVGEKSVAEELIHRSQGLTLVVVDAESDESTAAASAAKETPAVALDSAKVPLSRLLTTNRVLVWQDPVTQKEVISALVKSIVANNSLLSLDVVLNKLAERESQGSTFLNEGIALPHARLESLAAAEVAIGLTHGGILDAPTKRPIEIVFLLLSPASGANIHLQLLAKAGRALQNRELRRALNESMTANKAIEALSEFEAARERGIEPAKASANKQT